MIARRPSQTLKDQFWVLVTGASSGFGEEFARAVRRTRSARLFVARRIEKLQALATELRERSRVDVIVEQVDLSAIAAVVDLHKRLRERGIAIDILINNAGHGQQVTFVDGTLDAALAMLQLDVVSLTAVTHVFAQDMRARGRGKILLVASLLAHPGRREVRGLRGRQSECQTPGRSPSSRTQTPRRHGDGALPGHVGHRIRHSGAAEDHARVEALDDAAGTRGASRDLRVAGRAHQRRARVGKQGHRDVYQGNASLATPSHFLSHHGCRN